MERTFCPKCTSLANKSPTRISGLKRLDDVLDQVCPDVRYYQDAITQQVRS